MQILLFEQLLTLPVVDAERKVRQHQILDHRNILSSKVNYSSSGASEQHQMKRITSELPLNCNITKECHICPEDSIRDDAEYCIKTGWRQVTLRVIANLP
jgi:hypothetical protein